MTIFPLAENWQLLHPKTKRWLPATVPGCVHTDLLRSQLIEDPFWGSNEWTVQWIDQEEWIYATVFSIPGDLLDCENVELVAEGLDTLATIWLNGQEIAKSENMFVGYRIAAKNHLRPGRNELRVSFAPVTPYIQSHLPADPFHEWNDRVGGCSAIRKQQCQFGWDWGPRLVTAGIYQPIRLEGWSSNRIKSLRIQQTHQNGEVRVKIIPELINNRGTGCLCSRLLLDGKVILETSALEWSIPDPQLWWPNGLGAQPLYDLEVELQEENCPIDIVRKRIGLRTIELERAADQWGESFQFKVNGVPLFAKGANWIPCHSFVTEPDRAFYDGLLSSASEANMNMLRVWGGGIYELDDFYDLCDEKGILVWQDFMFSCAQYPGDEHFLALVSAEAEYQVSRLAHHASLALWCGNNELEMMSYEILKTEARKKAYDDIFYKILPAAVREFDGVTPYWPSSPHNPNGFEKVFQSENGGDCHFWEVWHQRKPIKRYEETQFRFVSEFGMQSYNSPRVAATYCAPEEFNVFSPAMENHQKNGSGNQIIFDYISRRYRFPKDYASLAYLSQLNQAYAIKIAVTHFRRSMPRCMGALYWQLNDCWPVFSWSSIEFGGVWKALHYEAKKFFAPALASAHVPGDERPGIGNYLESTIHEVNFYTVYDGIKETAGLLKWALYQMDGAILREGAREVTLRFGESVLHEKVDFAAEMEHHGAANICGRLWLECEGNLISQDTILLTAPRFLNLHSVKIETEVREGKPGESIITFLSRVFQCQVFFDLPGTDYRATDNYFDLFPGIPWSVRVAASISGEEVRRRLIVKSLVDSY